MTDTGLHLLAEMDTAAAIDADDVQTETFGVAHLENKDEDHPLLTDTRPIQRMLWKVAPLGYPYAEDAPMTLIDGDAFETAGGTVAGTTDGRVGAGSIFTDDEAWQGIHAIGGLLPPANQTELHPFGLKNHVLSFFGHTVLTNALGFEQVRIVDGEETMRIGDAEQGPIKGVEPEFTVEGAREDSGSIFTGGQTNRTELEVEVLEPDDETVLVRDTVPETWDVDETDGNILRVYVDPDHRGVGIGSELLEATRDRLFDVGVDRIKAMVLEENDMGNAFYREFGFEKTDTQEIQIGEESYTECTYTLEGSS